MSDRTIDGIEHGADCNMVRVAPGVPCNCGMLEETIAQLRERLAAVSAALDASGNNARIICQAVADANNGVWRMEPADLCFALVVIRKMAGL